MTPLAVSDRATQSMWDLIERLFPIHRSILGPGIARVLEVLGEAVPLQVRSFPSGLRCGSWTVPQEWSLEEAYVARLSGERVLDWRQHGLHVWLYSRPFQGRVSRAELLAHLVTRPDRPRAIPVAQTFYREQWGFCASQEQAAALTDPEYDVVIRSHLYDGVLRLGEAVLPGMLREEILLDSYICHPHLANDNQSGIAVAVELFKLLQRLPHRRYTYRLLLGPETIGPTVYLHQEPGLRQRFVGGYTFVCCGDPSPFHYRSSYAGDSVTDRAMRHALRYSGQAGSVEPFDVRSGTTGNEKAYNAPGFRIPIGSLRRAHIGAYPEHCTSEDNVSLLSPEALLQTLQVSWLAIQALERDVIYTPTFIGEPFLTHYGIYPHGSSLDELRPWDYLKAFVDGQRSLLAIAEQADLCVTAFDTAVTAFVQHGLLEEKLLTCNQA
ncbi:MAG: DUF4910 domain-containing protein [Candidatus Tectimicrobiota bacterium]